MVPEGWSHRKLEEVLHRVVDPVEVNPTDIYQEIGIRSHGKGIFHKEPVQGEKIGNKRVFWVKSDCFIVNIVFAWEQAVARTTQEEVGKIASHRFPMYRPKDDAANVDFLTYYFKTPRGKRLLGLASPGGAGRNKTLGQKEFGNIGLLLPTGGEQQKIARILSTWDKAIETVERLIENSKAQKKALMQQLLTGKRQRSESSSEYRRLRIADVAQVDIRSLGIKTPSDYSFRYISLSDVDSGYIADNLDSYVFSSAPSRARRVVEEGDILMATVRPNLQAFVRIGADHAGCVASTGFAVLTPKKGFHRDYLYHYLFSSHITGQLHALVVGSGYPALNSADVRSLSIYCPAYEEQRTIARILNKADLVTDNLLCQSSRLKEQKTALMQQLLTGKRRVKIDPEAG